MEVGSVVRSKAGHDKNRYYVVVETSENFVKIVDGKMRKLEAPKQKNKKHVSFTHTTVNLKEITSNKALYRKLESMNQSLREGSNIKGED